MSEHDSPSLGCPGQHARIRGAAKAYILCTDQIEISLLAQQATGNIAVEVFVGK
jgi:hypothetical protein